MSATPPPARAFGPPIVIAHRGACGYLPEHTLVAKAYAHALGTDFLEQDVVLSRDDVPVVFHDLVLEEVTDVAQRHPGRRRGDGHWYVIDFDYAELRELEVRERVEPATGAAAYPGRFQERLPLRIQSLAEELAFVRGLNAATGRRTGVYTEVKSPAFHRAAGKDLSPIVLATLAEFGYRNRADGAWLQCFDAAELVRIRRELGSALRLVQLVGENAWREAATDYDALRTPAGLAGVSAYADGIGPWIPQIVRWPRAGAAPEFTTLVADAHAAGLAVHPYTLRIDQLPEHAPDAEAVHRALFETAGVDGLFTDFCDVTLAYLGRRSGGSP
ncbi:MAG TPA: glycerophosphodiester phosphodiesterase [Steroidobacteraceae bacterium]|nr:glycerophosphodiester phosphodiesterase [Steroidobacteraceae bacterium]